MRYGALILACVIGVIPLHAQLQGNGPLAIEGFIADGNSSGAGHYDITIPTSINTGELIVACAGGWTGALPFTVTSTPAETWNSLGSATNGGNSRNIQLFYTTATSTGSYTIDLAFTPGNGAGLSVAHYTNTTGTLDGSIATNNATGTPASVSTTQTTANNGDLLVSCAAGDGGGSALMPASPANYVAYDESSAQAFQAYQYGGTHGSQTVTWTNASATTGGTGLSAGMEMQTAAFVPTAVAITDSSLPQGANGVAYEAQLHCVGGTGTITYSLFSGSLPTGLSLNTSTGEITGSTTSVGTTALGFRCTDSIAGASATRTLNLQIVGGFGTPAIRQIQVALNASGTTTLASPAACGSILGIIMHGFDTHGRAGWLQNDSGSTNSIKDGQGNILHRVPLVGNTNLAPLVAYISDPINYSGTATINVNKTTTGSPLMATFFEISGAQSPASFATFSNRIGNVSSPFTLASSYTTKVANELLIGVTASNIDSDTYAVSAPFSINIQGDGTCSVGFDCIMLAGTTVAAAGSTTLTTTVTTSQPSRDNTGNLMLAFRPGSSTCTAVVGPGEKHRRQVTW